MDLTLSFESGTELELAAPPIAFRRFADELEELGLASYAQSIKAHARLIRIADDDRLIAGRALGAVIAHL